MRIISKKSLREFWEEHPNAKSALQVWYEDARRSHWQTPVDIKHSYRNASIIGDNRVVFNITMLKASESNHATKTNQK